MFSVLLDEDAAISSACFLTVVISSSSACVATAPMIPARQWKRSRYDVADHPARLGLAVCRRGAA